MGSSKLSPSKFVSWFEVAGHGLKDPSRLNEATALQFFARSGLKEDVQQKVWQLSRRGKSTLNYERFVEAMELLALQQQTGELSLEALAAARSRPEVQLLPELGEDLDVMAPQDPGVLASKPGLLTRLIRPRTAGRASASTPASAHSSQPGSWSSTPPQRIQSFRDPDDSAFKVLKPKTEEVICAQSSDSFNMDDIDTQAQEQAHASGGLLDDLAEGGRMTYNSIMQMADKLPNPGPTVAKLVAGVVDWASKAYYNKQNCLALSKRSRVLLIVVSENAATFKDDAGCRGMLERFKKVMVDVEAFVMLFTAENLLRRGLHAFDDQDTYESLWSSLTLVSSDLTTAMTAAHATISARQLQALREEMLAWQGQEKLIRQAVEEHGGLNAVLRGPHIQEEIKSKMSIENQLLITAIEKCPGQLRTLASLSDELYSFWHEQFGVSTKQTVKEFFALFPHQLPDNAMRTRLVQHFDDPTLGELRRSHFMASLPNLDGEPGIISLTELNAAISEHLRRQPMCSFVDLMLALSTPPPRQLFPNRSVPGYTLAPCQQSDVEAVVKLLKEDTKFGVVALVGGPCQGLTTLAKELCKAFQQDARVCYVDLQGHCRADDALSYIMAELQKVFHVGELQTSAATLVELLGDVAASLERSSSSAAELLLILDHCDPLLLQLQVVHPMDALPKKVALVFTSRKRDHGFMRHHVSRLTPQDAASIMPTDATIEDFLRVATRDGMRDPDEVIARVAEACGFLPLAVSQLVAHVGSLPIEDVVEHRPGWLGGAAVREMASPGLQSLALKFARPITELSVEQRRQLLIIAILPPWCSEEVLSIALDLSESDTRALLQVLEAKWLVESCKTGKKTRWKGHAIVRAIASPTYDTENGGLLWELDAWQSLKAGQARFIECIAIKMKKAHDLFAGRSREKPDPSKGLSKLRNLLGSLREAAHWLASLQRPDGLLATYARLFYDETGLLDASGYLLGPDTAVWKAALKKCVKLTEVHCKLPSKGAKVSAGSLLTAVYAQTSLGHLLCGTDWFTKAHHCMTSALKMLEGPGGPLESQPPGSWALELLRIRLLLARARCYYMPLSHRGVNDALSDVARALELLKAQPLGQAGVALQAAALELQALCKDAQHRWGEAQDLLQECLRILEDLHGPSHLNVAQAQSTLSQVLINRGAAEDHPRALQLSSSTLETRKQLLPVGHHWIAKALLAHAKTHNEHNERKEARDCLQEALGIGRALPREQPDLEPLLVADCLVGLANIMKTQSSAVEKEAERLLQEAKREGSTSEAPPVVDEAHRKQAYYGLRRKEYKRALEIYTAYLPEKKVQIAALHEKLAWLDEKELKVVQAMEQYRKAYQMQQDHLGDHPATASTAIQLAKLLQQQLPETDSTEWQRFNQELHKLLQEAQRILKAWKGEDDTHNLNNQAVQILLLCHDQARVPGVCPVSGYARGNDAAQTPEATILQAIAEMRDAVTTPLSTAVALLTDQHATLQRALAAAQAENIRLDTFYRAALDCERAEKEALQVQLQTAQAQIANLLIANGEAEAHKLDFQVMTEEFSRLLKH